MPEQKTKTVKITLTIDDYDYYLEHALEKGRTLANMARYSLKRYCAINPLQREKEAKRKRISDPGES